jgi:hypothetical protein
MRGTSSSCEPGVAAAEAEADGEDRRRAVRAQIRDAGGDVGLHAFGRRLLAVRRIVEVLSALLRARRAAVEIERDGRVAALREPEGELLVEPVQAADVGEDDDPRRGRLVRARRERGEAVPVRRLEHQVVVRHRGARQGRDRRERVVIEAHAAGSYGRAAYESAMAEEQSHREEMSAAIRAQRERLKAASTPEKAARNRVVLARFVSRLRGK